MQRVLQLAALAAALLLLLLLPSPRAAALLRAPPPPPRRWAHRPPSGAPLTIAYAGFPAGFDHATADRELWLLAYLLEQATGRPTAPSNHSLPLERQLAGADVIIATGFAPGGRAELEATLQRHRPHALLLFSLLENVERAAFAEYSDQMVRAVHASLGVLEAAPGNASNYVHYPAWSGWVLERGTGCTLPRAWSSSSSSSSSSAAGAAAAAAAWRARPGFAGIVASHGDAPRAELCQALAGAGLGAVEGGGAFLGAPGSRLPPAPAPAQPAQKHAFLARYRFAVCPENSRSRSGRGYVTEKLPQALAAGGVPVYWGDATPPVFNAARVLRYSGGGELGAVVEAARALSDASSGAAEQWFAQPLLAPGAQAWVDAWCAAAQGVLARGWAEAQREAGARVGAGV
jgi:hypothetical protein